MGIKAIITGVTGMVGEGVLLECLQSADVESVLTISRKPSGVSHLKLKEIIHADFFNLKSIEHDLSGYDACFFCLGVSSIGMKEPEYTRLTYTLTMNFAETLVRYNKEMIFCYISGASTDSTEKGRQMWARVKGKTENDLGKLPFKAEYNFRPGFMKPTAGQKNVLRYYKYIGWLYPFLRRFFPSTATTLKELGLAMIYVAKTGYPKNIIEVPDIVSIAAQ